MNCKWCLREVQQDNGKAVQFCSEQCQMMHPFGELVDELNRRIDNGEDENELMLCLNRTGSFPKVAVVVRPVVEPEIIYYSPGDLFDK